MKNVDKKCPWCGLRNSVSFPCCGFLCMACGKVFEEEDIQNKEDLNDDRNSVKTS
jgi:hypothetical protein